jgi:hypothetical protein
MQLSGHTLACADTTGSLPMLFPHELRSADHPNKPPDISRTRYLANGMTGSFAERLRSVQIGDDLASFKDPAQLLREEDQPPYPHAEPVITS